MLLPIKFQYISCYSLSQSRNIMIGREEVSIHLMLLFIKIPGFLEGEKVYVSIHLMLLFISGDHQITIITIQFQYISCYSLSWEEGQRKTQASLFQYISCYSLSVIILPPHYPLALFQYISCYSLSHNR